MVIYLLALSFTSISTLHIVQRPQVIFPFIELVKNLLENIIGGNSVKQGHARTDLHCVKSAKYLNNILIRMYQQSLCDCSQPFVQNWMIQICLSLIVPADTIILCIIAVSEDGQLREYIPYPMRTLSSVFHFLQCQLITV